MSGLCGNLTRMCPFGSTDENFPVYTAPGAQRGTRRGTLRYVGGLEVTNVRTQDESTAPANVRFH